MLCGHWETRVKLEAKAEGKLTKSWKKPGGGREEGLSACWLRLQQSEVWGRKNKKKFWAEESKEQVHGLALRNWPSCLLVRWLWLPCSRVTPNLLLPWSPVGLRRSGWGSEGNKITKGEKQTQKELATPKLQMINKAIQVRESTIRIGNCPKWNWFYRIVWKRLYSE